MTYHTRSKIAQADPAALAKLGRIGESLAKRIIDACKI